MFIFRVLILAFLYVFTLGAVSSPMSGTAVEKYIQKKLKRNNKILRFNEKNLGDSGLAVLAQSPLLRSVTTLVLSSEEHTSELQSRRNLACLLPLVTHYSLHPSSA